MSEVTQEAIDKAIKDCMWLSQNRDKSMIEGICCGEIGMCFRVIENGKCPTLRKLFGTDKILVNGGR